MCSQAHEDAAAVGSDNASPQPPLQQETRGAKKKAAQFESMGLFKKKRSAGAWLRLLGRLASTWTQLLTLVIIQVSFAVGTLYMIIALGKRTFRADLANITMGVAGLVAAVMLLVTMGAGAERRKHGTLSYVKSRMQDLLQCQMHLTTLYMSSAFIICGCSFGSVGICIGIALSVFVHLPTHLLGFRLERSSTILDSLMWINNELSSSAKYVLEENSTGSANPQVFAVHPHGNLPLRVFKLMLLREDTIFKKTVLFFSSQVALVPPYRIYMWFKGGMMPITKSNLNNVMEKREKDVMICPGGVHEYLLCEPYRPIIRVSRKHKGFVRMCVKFGYDITPVFDFGGNDSLHAPLRFCEKKLYKTSGFPVNLFWTNRFWLPIPNNIPIRCAVGSPIVVEKKSDPSEEYINKIYEMYWRATNDLFDKHKDAMGYGDRSLEWVDS